MGGVRGDAGAGDWSWPAETSDSPPWPGSSTGSSGRATVCSVGCSDKMGTRGDGMESQADLVSPGKYLLKL